MEDDRCLDRRFGRSVVVGEIRVALLFMKVGSIVGACMGLKVIEPLLKWLHVDERAGVGGEILRREGQGYVAVFIREVIGAGRCFESN